MLPDHSFVLIGPEQTSFAELKKSPNVHFLGAKPHDQIPLYIRHFDVCLMPYVVDSFSNCISPAKLNEYLALGKPVVSTGLREVRSFNAEHGGEIVMIADGADEFRRRIDEALRDGVALRLRRREIAEANSWNGKAEHISALIEAELRHQS
jgi:glycosyltransferase involved in cell wall biosynthesis